VQEAQASGLPVIAPDAGGPRDIVAPYRTGLLLPVAEFESRLEVAVDHLIDERHRYSIAARRSVLGRTWGSVCEELLGHYRAVHTPWRDVQRVAL
jgi:phosphatidylinositol alpha 1,6-mannosyltransferase